MRQSRPTQPEDRSLLIGYRLLVIGYSEGTRLWREQIERRKITPQISAIDGRQSIALVKRMGADEEIRNQIAARTALLAVSLEELPGFKRCMGIDGIEADTQTLQGVEHMFR